MVTLKTNYGDIKLSLHKDVTPKTVDNFLNYVNTGFYNNTLFHRVIPGFMIQGGGFAPGMESKKTMAPIENEAAKGHKNLRGTVAMARTSDPHSASSQFFINVADNSFLDYKSDSVQGFGYCVFAEVVEGMDIVDKIALLKTTSHSGHQDVPYDDVIIDTAIVETEEVSS